MSQLSISLEWILSEEELKPETEDTEDPPLADKEEVEAKGSISDVI